MSVLTCIRCPRGCRVEVVQGKGGEIVSVEGNACPRGASYARDEVTNPMRALTTTVRVRGASQRALSVKSSADLPKGRVLEVVRALASCEVVPPVRMGDVVVADVCHTGVDIVATSSVGE